MLHENAFITHNAMFFVYLAREWAAKNDVPIDGIVYMIGEMDVNIPVNFPYGWPFFKSASDKDARKYFEANYPHTRHLVKIDLSLGNPNAAWKEI